ncbi:hypothetical protein LTR53_017684 [Teratosphaeriaceae sp. CCFEE 6253]|nr:hypothetical protein LTR53_017684 [Teratosphaeriaceae sp. CCFEE 6253]
MAVSGTGNTAPGFTIATVLFVLWALCSYAVRAWTKHKKTDIWGWDDTAMTFALVAALCQVITLLYGVHRGYGGLWSHLETEDLDAVSKILFAAQILFVLSTGATRASAASFSARVLTMDVRQQRVANGLVGLCGLWTIGSMIGIAVRRPLMHPWSSFDGSQVMFARWMPIEITGILLDFCCLALSVFFIWQLQMSVLKRLAVCAIFAVRLATIPIIACRLWALAPKPEDAERADIGAAVLTEAQMCFALILASATCLKPFLQPFHPGWFVAKTGVTGLTGNSSGQNTKRANTYYELSGARSAGGVMSSKDRKNRTITSVTSASDARGDDASDEAGLITPYDKAHLQHGALRPDRAEHHAGAFAPATAVMDMRGAPDARRWPDSREDTHHISKAQSWSVTYD